MLHIFYISKVSISQGIQPTYVKLSLHCIGGCGYDNELNLGQETGLSIFTNRLQRPLQAVKSFDFFETKYDELLGKLKLKNIITQVEIDANYINLL